MGKELTYPFGFIREKEQIREANRLLNWSIPENNAKTINGYILESLENIPTKGMKFDKFYHTKDNGGTKSVPPPPPSLSLVGKGWDGKKGKKKHL